MCHNAPASGSRRLQALILGGLILVTTASGQQPVQPSTILRPDWRQIGNSTVDLFLASPATGPVDRVWFSEDGSRLYLRTRYGRSFETGDFEEWKSRPSLDPPPEETGNAPVGATLPAADSKVRGLRVGSLRFYAFDRYVYRSDDGGRHWTNLTSYRQESIIGGGMQDLTVSSADPDHIVAANEHGVWRSLDGGLSWIGLNDSLPNLPVRRLLETPSGSRGMRVLLEGLGAVEWAPGEKYAWRLVEHPQLGQEEAIRLSATERLAAEVTAVAIGDGYSYAGARDGRLWVSSDQGRTWRFSRAAGGGPIEALYVDPDESRVALAAVGAGEESGSPRVLRTINGGIFWDDLTADLPEGSAHGVTADRATGAIYVATDRGVFLSFADLFAAGPAGRWIPMAENLPPVPAVDVRLDPAGNQLYVALRSYGVYAAPAPHRFRDLRIVNAADFSQRPAAPGSLLSVLGGRLMRAQAGYVEAPVLHATDIESQIQVPFEVSGRSTLLALELVRGQLALNLPLQDVSPAIFVDRDGTPLLMDADSGLLLDAMSPARSNTRIQILAAGLGRVSPAWPTGMAAPLERPPRVVAPLRVYVDRVPVEVTRATLAPGYVGFYLVEVQLPAIVNAGPAELYLEAEREESNRVRIYLEP